jgi:hypothetical protein
MGGVEEMSQFYDSCLQSESITADVPARIANGTWTEGVTAAEALSLRVNGAIVRYATPPYSTAVWFASAVVWFRLEAEAGTSYEVAVDLGCDGCSLPAATAALSNTDGVTELTKSKSGGLVWTCPANGMYYVSVSGLGNATGRFELVVRTEGVTPEQGLWVHANGPSVQQYTSGLPTMVEYEGAVVWFRLVAAAGTTYEVVVVDLGCDGCSLLAAVAKLVHTRVIPLTSQFPTDVVTELVLSESGSLVWVCPASGTYYVSVSGLGNATGSFGLVVHADEACSRRDLFDHFIAVRTNEACRAGCSAGSGNCPGDWHPSGLDECSLTCSVVFEPFWEICGGLLTRAVGASIHIDNELLDEFYYNCLQSKAENRAENQALLVNMPARIANGTWSEGVTAAEALPVHVDGAIVRYATPPYSTAVWSAGTVVWFWLEAETGTTYEVAVDLGCDGCSLPAAAAALVGPNGATKLAESGSGSLVWTCPANGTYYVSVSGLGGTMGTFELSVTSNMRGVLEADGAYETDETHPIFNTLRYTLVAEAGTTYEVAVDLGCDGCSLSAAAVALSGTDGVTELAKAESGNVSRGKLARSWANCPPYLHLAMSNVYTSAMHTIRCLCKNNAVS